MNLLLDTHAMIWYLEDAKELPKSIAEEIEKIENKIAVSIASFWEIAIKITIGKLPTALPIETIEKQLQNAQIDIISITVSDAKRYIGLPLHHRDPFDRMLAAQTIERGWTIVSKDEIFDRYGATRLW